MKIAERKNLKIQAMETESVNVKDRVRENTPDHFGIETFRYNGKLQEMNLERRLLKSKWSNKRLLLLFHLRTFLTKATVKYDIIKTPIKPSIPERILEQP